MDILMISQDILDGIPQKWDIELKAGRTTALSGRPEQQQRAVIAAYIQLGTIPSLETTGIDWTGFLTGLKNARELDSDIRNNMRWFTGEAKFIPYYFTKNNTLRLSIQEAELNVN